MITNITKICYFLNWQFNCSTDKEKSKEIDLREHFKAFLVLFYVFRYRVLTQSRYTVYTPLRL